jgi:hypothetical protein
MELLILGSGLNVTCDNHVQIIVNIITIVMDRDGS